MPEPLPATTYTLAQAIARVEGWYAATGDVPNRPQRNNNPGDIELSHFADHLPGFDPTGTDKIFARFTTAEAGWFALQTLLLSPSYQSLTVEQAINRYAPPVENNTESYVSIVCKLCECQPGDLVSKVYPQTAVIA